MRSERGGERDIRQFHAEYQDTLLININKYVNE